MVGHLGRWNLHDALAPRGTKAMPHYPVVLTPDENGTVIAEVPDIDLDGMNWVNDNFGHPVGDAFLRDAGIFCSDIAEQHCVDAYRTDGDETTFVGDDAVRTSQALDADRALAQDQYINQ